MSVERPSLFLLDSNVLMAAHHGYYAPDLCPGFWESVLAEFNAGRVLSIDRVRDEVKGPKALVQWVDQAPNELFVSTADEPVQAAFSQLMAWTSHNTQVLPAAKEEFARVADGWLVAYAKANDAVVVTNEVFDPTVKKRIPIPNVCKRFNVEYRNTFEMLRELGVKFDLRRR